MSRKHPPHRPPPHPSAPGPYGPPRKRFSTGAVVAVVVGGVLVLLVALGLADGGEAPADGKAGKPPVTEAPAPAPTTERAPAPDPAATPATGTAPKEKAESGTRQSRARSAASPTSPRARAPG
ncbi:hypothetical protein ACIGW0_29130 [Streptomyces bikiniensis]|uniref:Uncharacterized protein n=1 Tax=Streptomyces bikiniensis TaxID=1896 RepID=A0ABW8D0P9_STRBI